VLSVHGGRLQEGDEGSGDELRHGTFARPGFESISIFFIQNNKQKKWRGDLGYKVRVAHGF